MTAPASIHIVRSHEPTLIQNLPKSVAPHRTQANELSRTQNQDGKMHENLTDAKIHRLTEVLAEVCGLRYFPDIYKCPAYGF